MNRYLADMKQDLQKTRGARKFVDVAKEGAPRFDEVDSDNEEAVLVPAVPGGDGGVDEDGEIEADEPEPADQSAAAAATADTQHPSSHHEESGPTLATRKCRSGKPRSLSRTIE